MPNPPRISEAEWDVMNVIWAEGPATAHDVHAALGDARAWTLRTVKTLIARLVKKGAVAFDIDGRRYVYRARVSRDECVAAESESFVTRVLGGKASPLVRHFVRAGHLTREEIRELRKLLEAEEENRS